MKKINELVRGNWVYGIGILSMLGFLVLYSNQENVFGAVQNGETVSTQVIARQTAENPLKIESNNVVTEAPKVAEKKTIAAVPRIESAQPAPVSVVSTPSLPPVQPPAPPVVVKDTTRLIISGLGSYDVVLEREDTAFDVLVRAAAQNKFVLEYKSYDWGKMITKIGTREAEGTYYWAFYYNGAYAQVGADAQKVNKNDVTEWRYESWE